MQPLRLVLLACAVAMGGIVVDSSALAQSGTDCQPPVAGRYSVEARQILPIGPTWTLRVEQMNDDRFTIEIVEKSVRFEGIELKSRELAGASIQQGARVSLVFDDVDGTVKGSLWIRAEYPEWKLEGKPNERGQSAEWKKYEN